MHKFTIFILISLLLILFAVQTTYATIKGIYRVSTYHIFDDGHFTYEVTIRVYNDLSSTQIFRSKWIFYTDDVNKIQTEGIQWEGSFIPFSGDDPWQPGLLRNGYSREFSVTVPGLSYITYKAFYTGPAVYWGFNNNQGTFYGDGSGGADTPFDDFYVNLTLPNNATSYTIINESSPHIELSTNPIQLRWIEHNVVGVTDNLSFQGNRLTTSKPVITIKSISPVQPTIYDDLTFTGIIQFPDGTAYSPGVGSFAVEDPWKQMTEIIAVNHDGTFTHTTSNKSKQPGGFPLFRFILNYQGELLYNYFNLYTADDETVYDFFADIKFDMSLYNHNSSFPATTDAFVYRSNNTPPPVLDKALDAGAAAAKNLWSYTRAMGREYWTSNTNKLVFVGTGVACGSLIIPNPVSASICAWGAKTIAISLGKSFVFVAGDQIIDAIPENSWDDIAKRDAKQLLRASTHAATFLIQPHEGGIKEIIDKAEFISTMGELGVKSARVVLEENDTQTSLDGYVLQCVDKNDEIWNFGIGRIEPNGMCFRAHSHVDIKVTDSHGRVIRKEYSNLPGAHYFEQDINGDGFLYDEIFIPGYSLGGYHLDVIQEGNTSPNDLVTLTMSCSWLDTTFVIANKTRVDDLEPQGYTVFPQKRTVLGRFWIDVDTLIYESTGPVDCYFEIPDGFDLSQIKTGNTLLNHRIRPSLVDNIYTDTNSNGISECHIVFLMDSINQLIDDFTDSLNFMFTLEVDYQAVNCITGTDTVVIYNLNPALDINPAEINLGKHLPGHNFTAGFTIKNNTEETVSGNISCDSLLINFLSPTSFSLAAGQQITINFSGNFPSSEGSFSTEIVVTADTDTQNVAVYGEVEQIPVVNNLARVHEPVLFEGGTFPELLGVELKQLHAFRFSQAENYWQEIPFQIDEMDSTGNYLAFIEHPLKNRLGEYDEVIIMSDDLGDRARNSQWINNDDSKLYPRYEIIVKDPLESGEMACFYIYRSSTLAESATEDYVDQADGTIFSNQYTLGHNISKGFINHLNFTEQKGDWGINLLDRQKLRLNGIYHIGGFTVNYVATEDDFKVQDVRYIDGQVRVIRYMDWLLNLKYDIFSIDISVTSLISKFYLASSQIASQKTKLSSTFGVNLFRHSIDLSSNIGEMLFYNPNNDAILLNGQPDNSVNKQLDIPGIFWGLTTGNPGTILQIIDLPSVPGEFRELYYCENSNQTADSTQDTGDNISWGDIGLLLKDNIVGDFYIAPVLHLEPAPANKEWAEKRIEQFKHPLGKNVLLQFVGTTVAEETAGIASEIKTYNLWPNYPNPFNSQTHITFQIPEPVHVKLSICNILGQEIRQLTDGHRQQGHFSLAWDGRDNSGKTVVSGIYLLRLQAGNFIKIRKVAFIR